MGLPCGDGSDRLDEQQGRSDVSDGEGHVVEDRLDGGMGSGSRAVSSRFLAVEHAKCARERQQPAESVVKERVAPEQPMAVADGEVKVEEEGVGPEECSEGAEAVQESLQRAARASPLCIVSRCWNEPRDEAEHTRKGVARTEVRRTVGADRSRSSKYTQHHQAATESHQAHRRAHWCRQRQARPHIKMFFFFSLE